MIQHFAIGELVHNIKTDEVGKVKELLLDTEGPTRYRVLLAQDLAQPIAATGGKEALWNEDDLIASSHKVAAS